jgi:hypothetical protein
MKTSPLNRREFFRALLRSRFGSVLLASLALLLGFAFAYALWHWRDLFVAGLCIFLIVCGFQMAMELYPRPDAERGRERQEEGLAERYPSYRFRHYLWTGIGMTIPALWHSYQKMSLQGVEFLVPAAFILAGAIAHAVWRVKHEGRRL